jgi:hypothetical protein
MLAQLRRRLTYANVVATLALFVAVSTGGAYAANTIFSTDIVDGEVKAPDIANAAVVADKLATGSVTSRKAKDNTLTGTDVLDGSIKGADIGGLTITGFDVAFNAIEDVHVKDDSLTDFDIREEDLFHCHGAGVLLGKLCVNTRGTGNISDASHVCALFDLRLPTLGEAVTLGLGYDVPGVGAGEAFWTDEIYFWHSSAAFANFVKVDENGAGIQESGANPNRIVCVETPTGLP